MKWRGKSYRPAFGVPVYPKKQNDIRELMKPLSEKTHKGNVWIPVVMNVPKEDVVPATPTPTPTTTSTPTPTPTNTSTPTPTPSATQPAALLLDTYTGATMAYSVRRLSSGYSGPAMRITRASDSTELDINFVSNDLDTSAIETFCSGTTGTVRTWYDQSGNGNDVEQPNLDRQPFIYTGSTVITINGLPTVRQTRTGSALTSKTLTGTTNITNPFTIVTTFAQLVDESGSRVISGNDRNSLIANRRTNDNSIFTEGFVYGLMWGSTAVLQTTFFSRSGSTDNVYTDLTSLVINTVNNSNDFGTLAIGVGANGEESQAVVSEFIAWGQNEIANRVSITNDVIDYYGL